MDEQSGQTQIPVEQVLQSQFAKVGQLQFVIDTMTQQMAALENENRQLKEQMAKTNESDLPK